VQLHPFPFPHIAVAVSETELISTTDCVLGTGIHQ